MELKDVIHYYIGQQCEVVSFKQGDNWVGMNQTVIDFHICILCKEAAWNIKPILRKIDSLTDDEKQQIFSELGLDSFISLDYFDKAITNLYCKPIDRFAPVVYFQAFHLLVKLGVDLFGLIDNNHAIDKASNKPAPKWFR